MCAQLAGTSADRLKTPTSSTALSRTHALKSVRRYRGQTRSLVLSEGSRDCTHPRENALPPSPTASLLCSSPKAGHAGMSQDESTPADSRGQLALIATGLAVVRRAGGLRSGSRWRQLSATARSLRQHSKDKQKPYMPLAACLFCKRGDRVPEVHISTQKLPLPSLAGL